jgi:uncharacterized protein (TIGR00369 family)
MRDDRKNELLRVFNEVAPIAKYFGMRLSYSDEGSAVIHMPHNPNLDHALGDVHGGVYATLLDSAGWFTAALAYERSLYLTTSDLSIRFLQPVHASPLKAVGRLIKCGKRLAIAEMHLYDEQDQLVGHATGTFVVLQNVELDG